MTGYGSSGDDVLQYLSAVGGAAHFSLGMHARSQAEFDQLVEELFLLESSGLAKVRIVPQGMHPGHFQAAYASITDEGRERAEELRGRPLRALLQCRDGPLQNGLHESPVGGRVTYRWPGWAGGEYIQPAVNVGDEPHLVWEERGDSPRA